MSRFSELVKKARERDSYWEASAKHEFAMQLLKLLQSENLSQKEFADRAGVSQSQISQILAGSTNLSLKSMLKYALALDCVVKVDVVPRAIAAKKGRKSQESQDAREWESFSRLLNAQPPAPKKFWELNMNVEPMQWSYAAGDQARVAEAA